jgi:DNA-binding IclR family transcriptional regulator
LLSLAEEKRREIIASLDFECFTENTITDRVSLEAELKVAQAQGFYLVVEDYELGTTSIAAPVKNHSQGIIATLTLIIPLARFTPAHRDNMIELVMQIAGELSNKLGYCRG